MKKIITYVFQTLFLLVSVISGQAIAGETVTYYHLDNLGSPVAASDEAGNLKWSEQYQPYGGRILKEGDGQNDIWFTGKPEEIGLSYMGARWYDAELGRFLAIDPVGFHEGNPQSFNRYAYANNNPYRYVDPDGRWSTEAHNYFIDNFAKNRGLNIAALESIKAGSKAADGIKYQFGGSAHMHAMGDGINSSETQRNKMNSFISEKFSKYQSLLAASKDSTGRRAKALKQQAYGQLGYALHAAMDSTSPAHEGFQIWQWNKETVTKHGDFGESLENLDAAKSAGNNEKTQRVMNKVMNGEKL